MFVSIEADCNTEVTDDAFWGVTSQISIRQKNLEKTIIAKRDVELSVDLLAKRIGSAKTGQERTEFTLQHALWANICSIATAYDLTPEEAKVHILSEYSDPKDRRSGGNVLIEGWKKYFGISEKRCPAIPYFINLLQTSSKKPVSKVVAHMNEANDKTLAELEKIALGEREHYRTRQEQLPQARIRHSKTSTIMLKACSTKQNRRGCRNISDSVRMFPRGASVHVDRGRHC